MADRAHIRNGQLIKLYTGERGWVDLENGDRASPVVIGFESGNDKVVPYTVTVNDTSTGNDNVSSSDTAVNADSVVKTVTVRDKTAQEISDEKDRVIDQLTAQNRELIIGIGMIQKNILGYMLDQSGLNAQQFLTAFNAADTISVTAYKSELKDRTP